MPSINREVGVQGKGFRLQRLRAIKLLIEKVKTEREAMIYVATEYLDDVYLKIVENNQVEETAESDKSYASRDSFTLATEEVRNSIVSFLDCWIENNFPEKFHFCFYTNVKIGKEVNRGIVKDLGINLPPEPLITYLMNKQFKVTIQVENENEEFDILNIVKSIIIEEYRRQYANKESMGYLNIIEKFTDEQFISFLQTIDWKFEQEDEEELFESLKVSIKYFSKPHLKIDGKEHLVISALLEEFEKRQNVKDMFSRFVTHDIFLRILYEVSNDQYRPPDPVAKMWDELDQPEDNRIIREKILDVCPNFTQKKLYKYERKIAAVKIELEQLGSKDKLSYKAYKYRVFTASEDRLDELKEENSESLFTVKKIEHWLEEIFEHSHKDLIDKAQDYAIPFKSQDTLYNTVLELFDSCYLQFEEDLDE